VFARRQRAWFRRDPRITWLDADADADADPSDRTQALLDLADQHWP
jgi:tRNA A37 N6-isopentenylltransferase MiaA